MIVRGLKKEFKNKLAVDGLNLDMYEGQTFAFLDTMVLEKQLLYQCSQA